MQNKKRLQRLWLPTLTLLGGILWLLIHWPQGGFWYDEALTTYVATDSWATLFRWCTQVDIQVPFHYIVLRLWSYAAGDSEFVLRLISALSILLALAGVIAIGRRLLKVELGIFAAVLLIATPGMLWIAYEVRAYALALALYVWATVFLLSIIDHALKKHPINLPLVIIYALLMIATLYTHYTGIGALASHVMILAITILVRRSGSLLRASILAMILIGIGFAPWLPVLLTRSAADHSYYVGAPILPGRALAVMLDFKLHGEDSLPVSNIWVVAAYGVLMVLGLIVGITRRQWRAALTSALIVLFPVVLTAVIVYFKPKLAGRYAWPAWIGFDLLIGLALMGLISLIARRTRLKWIRYPMAFSAVAVIICLPWVAGERGGPPNSDFRGAYATICAQGTPDDMILLRDGTLFVTADYYDKRCPTPHLAPIGMPDAQITDVQKFLTLQNTQDAMQQISAKNPPNVWVIAWQGDVMDPQQMAYALLDGTGKHTQQQFGDVQLDRYENPKPFSGDPLTVGQPLNITPIADGPTLVTLRVIAPPTLHVGDLVELQAWWLRGKTLQPDLLVDAQLTTADGGYAYQDFVQPPSSWKFKDDRWQPGIPALGRYEFRIADYMHDKVKIRYVIQDSKQRWSPRILDVAEMTIQNP